MDVVGVGMAVGGGGGKVGWVWCGVHYGYVMLCYVMLMLTF